MQQDSLPAPPARAGDQIRALLGLGLPLVGSHLAQMAIVTTDTLMMGWYNIPSLAALSLSGPIWFNVFVLGSGFGWAVMPMIASALSQGDGRQVRRITRMGLWLSALWGLIVTPFFIFAESIFLAIGQDPEVSRLAGIYMVWLGLAMTPALLVNVLKSYLSALELTRAILFITILGAMLNFVFDWLLIFGNLGFPELGISGAGIASLLGNLIAFGLLAVYAGRARPSHQLFRNIHRIDREYFARVFRLGWPIGLTTFAEVGLFAAATTMMGWVGTIQLAAHGIALQIASLTFMVHMGLSQAITVRGGRYWGVGDRDTLKVASLAAMGMSLTFAGLTIIVFLTIPSSLVGLFVDPEDPQRPAILAAGASLLAVAALFQLVDSGQVMALGMLRGVQDTRVPMIMAVVSYWLVGLPVSYVMGFTFGLGGTGIWLGLTVGLAGACLMMQTRYWMRYPRPV